MEYISLFSQKDLHQAQKFYKYQGTNFQEYILTQIGTMKPSKETIQKAAKHVFKDMDEKLTFDLPENYKDLWIDYHDANLDPTLPLPLQIDVDYSDVQRPLGDKGALWWKNQGKEIQEQNVDVDVLVPDNE